jgi:hypothetical protein
MLTACCVLGLSACATHQALDNQLATSREALEQAKTAGAQQAAPADFNTASEKLSKADAEAKRMSWSKTGALRLAEQAQADANLAHAKAEAFHATTAANELEQSNEALRKAISHAKAKPNQ